uniref:26S proteasome non-ATPase regulatory subunit 14 n=2 Tax=Schistocephalus solidus TaxID=70667 RepID=A0A0V0J5K5_SCHSO
MSSVSTVVVEPSAYHAMLMEAYLNPDKEVCGLLFGQLEPESVRVLGHFPSEVTDPTNLAKAQELVKEIVDSESTEQVKLVGWYHTHAGRGCEPTLSDTFLQDRFQNLLPHFVGLVLTVGETSVHEPTQKTKMRAFKTLKNRQLLALPVQIGPATGALTVAHRRLAISSLAEITRLSSSDQMGRLDELCRQPTLASMRLILVECQRWNSSVSGAIVENVDFLKQAFDLGLV